MSTRPLTYAAPLSSPVRVAVRPATPATTPVTPPATIPTFVLLLAGLTVLLHALDLVTFLRLTAEHGTSLEANPIIRAAFIHGGSPGVAVVKLGIVVVASALFVLAARSGRLRFGRNCLALAATMGLVGFLSNVVAGL